ncbi:MAG: TonB-dependent receptor family protein [Mangrovibacterium sp.]
MESKQNRIKRVKGFILLIVLLYTMTELYGHNRNASRNDSGHATFNMTDRTDDTIKVGEIIVLSDQVKKSRVIIPTSQITGIKLDQFSPVGLNEAINQTPGVYIQSGAINTNRITIRGVGARTLYGTNKIRAYLNGIPITNGVGETSIDSYDPEDLENIEIIKGPKATGFGTNLGGTILLNTSLPVPGEAGVRNNTSVGSFGLFKNTTVADYGDDLFSVHLHYDHLQSDGFRENSAYNRNGWLLNASYFADENSVISIVFQQISYFARIASSIGKTAFDEDPSQAASNWKDAQGYEDNRQTLVGLSYSRNFDESFRNTTSFFYNGTIHYEPRPFNILDENTDGYGVRTVFSKTVGLWSGRAAELHFGGEWYADQYDWETKENLYEQNNGQGSLEGDLLSKNREFRNYFNVFASATLPLTARMKAQVGLNFNTTSYDYNDRLDPGPDGKSAIREFDPVLAPNFSLTYRFTSDQLGYANVSRGFNYPGLEETLTPEGALNPDIGPEKGWNYELGTDLLFFRKKLHLNAAAYLLQINGLLVAQRTGEDQYVGRNAGKTRHKGIEIAADYQLNLFPQFTISPYLNASFDFHRFVNFVDEGNDYSGNDLTGVPDKRISAGIRFRYGDGLYVYSGYEHTGSMPLNDANTLYSDAWNLLNLKIGYQADLSKHLSVEANAGVNNVTDEKYASSVLINAVAVGGAEPRYYYPGMPRNYYGGLKVTYRF